MCAQMSDLVFESEPRVIGHGFKFTEGPLWHPNGFLLFTDIPANTVYRWEPGGQTLAYLKPSRNANGLTWDKQGNLLQKVESKAAHWISGDSNGNLYLAGAGIPSVTKFIKQG